MFQVKQQMGMLVPGWVTTTMLVMIQTPRNSSAWHNLYGCEVQPLDHCMDPAYSYIDYLLLGTQIAPTGSIFKLKFCHRLI